VGFGGAWGVDRVLRGRRGCRGLVARGGRQVGRCGFAFTPAFGRVVASATRRFMARLKPCPFEGSLGCGCGRWAPCIPPMPQVRGHEWGTRDGGWATRRGSYSKASGMALAEWKMGGSGRGVRSSCKPTSQNRDMGHPRGFGSG
jgi:hypothetical protein